MNRTLTIRLDPIDAANVDEMKHQTRQTTASKAIKTLISDYSLMYSRVGKLRWTIAEIRKETRQEFMPWQQSDEIMTRIANLCDQAEFDRPDTR